MINQITNKVSVIELKPDVCDDEIELKLGDYEIEIRDGKIYTVLNKPREIQKEIHFHKDSKDFPIEEFNYYGYYHVNHISTMEAIKNDDDLIITTALTALNFHSLLDKDYKIFLHENGRVGEVYEGVTELSDKELKKGHDIARIWIGGGFYDYFYKTS